MVASTRAYSRSGSSETASNNRCQTPAFTQSRKRAKAPFRGPNAEARRPQDIRMRPSPPLPPIAEAGEDAVPVAKRRRQIAPGTARARNPQHGFDKQAVVLAAAPRIARLAQATRFHLRPWGVGQKESIHPKLESQPSLDGNP